MSIKHWFIPTHRNKFHPHALRPLGLFVFLAVFVTIPFLYNITSAKQMQVLGYATSISVGQLVVLTNQERANNGLPALVLDSQLNNAAVAKANHMFANNYWAHVAPDGTTPWYFITASGYNYSVAGENLAKDFNTSSGVMNGWMGSDTHRANILNASYADVGFAVIDGTLLGSDTTLVVAMYGAKVVTTPAQTKQEPALAPSIAPAPPVSQSTATPTPVSVQEPERTIAEAPILDEKATENTDRDPIVPISDASTRLQGQVEGATTLLPVKVYGAMNWGQKASLTLLSLLMLLFIMKHTLVWRQQKRGLRHIWLRAHPLSQVAVLASAFVITILSSTGVII